MSVPSMDELPSKGWEVSRLIVIVRELPLKRIPVPVPVNLAAADMVGGADQPFALHPLDPFGGGVVSHAHLALQP